MDFNISELLPVLVLAATGVIGWLIGKVQALVKSTPTQLDDQLLAAVKKALTEDKTV